MKTSKTLALCWIPYTLACVHSSNRFCVWSQYGPSRSELYDLPFMPERWAEAVQPFSGDLACAPSGGWDNQASIWLVQQRPLPFRILALTLDITFA